jgi:GDSL-like Lipase/Acylhydrolase family/N-terminus of Esterase_SGNH_hydro-type
VRVRIALLLWIALALTPSFAEDRSIQWTAFPNAQFRVDGLPWLVENGGELFRLPVQFKSTYPRSVWNLAERPTGARIRFRTDSTLVALRLEYPQPPWMKNMHAIGQSGVDLYVGNTYWGNMSADKEARPGKIYEHVYFNLPDQPRSERQITLYLPVYESVKVIALGLDPQAKIKPPQPFALTKPVVFYGTSITQGGCASRPGMNYEAILGRRLNIDFVNLGFSGAGKYEPEVGRQVGKIDAACFVLDGSNIAEASDQAKVYGPFVDLIRARHPKTPILAISPIYSAEELTTPSRKRQLAEKRALTRTFVSSRIAAGDENIYLVEGTDLLGAAQGAGLVDGAHPNDLGFQWIADGLIERLARVLGLSVDAP